MTDDDRAALVHELQAVIEASAGGDAAALVAEVCATLRRFGHDAFATQYASAFDRWKRAIETVATGAAFSDNVNAAAVAAKDDASAAFISLTAEICALADTTKGNR